MCSDVIMRILLINLNVEIWSWRYICKCLSLKSKSVCIAKCVCNADVWIEQYIFVIKVICLWILLNCLFISELAGDHTEDSCQQVIRSVQGSAWWCEDEVQVKQELLYKNWENMFVWRNCELFLTVFNMTDRVSLKCR